MLWTVAGLFNTDNTALPSAGVLPPLHFAGTCVFGAGTSQMAGEFAPLESARSAASDFLTPDAVKFLCSRGGPLFCTVFTVSCANFIVSAYCCLIHDRNAGIMPFSDMVSEVATGHRGHVHGVQGHGGQIDTLASHESGGGS